jgi:hypothetical protein
MAAGHLAMEFLSNAKPTHVAVAVFVIVSTVYYRRYRKAIKQRIQQLEEESWIFGLGVTMERMKDSVPRGGTSFRQYKLLELNPSLREKCTKDVSSILSLGEYMSSLQPKGIPQSVAGMERPQFIEQEIQAGMAAALLKALGPNLGRALLPAMETLDGKAHSLATGIATKWFASSMEDEMEKDKGGLPLSLMTLLAVSDTNAKVNPPTDSDSLSAIDKMKLGEIGVTSSFIPTNPFIVSRDFEAAIEKMEDELRNKQVASVGQSTRELDVARLELMNDELLTQDMKIQEAKEGQKQVEYDPEGRNMVDPLPINPRLFPGLHLGWGNAKCTHTNREVLKNRLLSVLLNKLGANYYMKSKGETDIFSVQISEKAQEITTPWELVQGLVDTGHEIEMVPKAMITTFGTSLSVLEQDGTWSNIPLACFVESGYEDAKGTQAPAFMPHSGLNMEVSGPLIGSRADGKLSKCCIQHYIAIEGFCGWHSNHNGDVPWLEAVECGTCVAGKDAVRAARLAGLYANVLNGVATEMGLPFGGYGLTAVCNDSAAVLQECLYGTSTIYPMTSIGSFMQRTLRYAQRFRDELKPHADSHEIKDMCAIITAMRKIPSDLNASPTNALNAAKRMLHCLPPDRPFQLMNDTKNVMESILHEAEVEAEVEAALNN